MDVAAAAAANAAWCDSVCRAHGIVGRVAAGAWVASRRTPPLYPDAMTLAPEVDPSDILALVQPGAGCSVKDSFADLDLTSHGFALLFEAEWWSAETAGDAPADGQPWTSVRSPDQLVVWEAAWRRSPAGRSSGPDPIFRPALLADEDVAFFGLPPSEGAGYRAGFVLSAGPSALALTNGWSITGEHLAALSAALHHARGWRPDLPLTTYVTAKGSPLFEAAGLTAVGPLRVWLA